MGKIILYFGLILLFTIVVKAQIRGECPLSSQHTSCSPKCIQDTQCSSMGGKCCPNLCNYKSCVIPKSSSNVGGSGYKGSGSSSGYCGNVKCNAYEKCDFDKATKRQKCVRT